MVLSGTKKTTYINSITNQNQGGGNKKAGFPGLIGRDSWVSIYYGSTSPVSGECCKLSGYSKNRFTVFPNQNLPVGYSNRIQMR
jgi:hypothetical protein